MDAIETGFLNHKFSNGTNTNQLVEKFEQFGGIQSFEELQKHPNLNISKKIDNISAVYFNEEEEEENIS